MRDRDAATKLQTELDRISINRDIVLLWNPEVGRTLPVGRWQVYQVRAENEGLRQTGFALPAQYAKMTAARKPYLMFTIQTNDGAYRTPGDEDFVRCIKGVNTYKFIEKHGSDAWMDKVEAKEVQSAKAAKAAKADYYEDVDKRLKWAAKKEGLIT